MLNPGQWVWPQYLLFVLKSDDLSFPAPWLEEGLEAAGGAGASRLFLEFC